MFAFAHCIKEYILLQVRPFFHKRHLCVCITFHVCAVYKQALTRSFTNANYHHAQIIKDGFSVMANSTILQKLQPVWNFDPDNFKNTVFQL